MSKTRGQGGDSRINGGFHGAIACELRDRGHEVRSWRHDECIRLRIVKQPGTAIVQRVKSISPKTAKAESEQVLRKGGEMRESVAIGAVDPILSGEQDGGLVVIQPDGAALGAVGKSYFPPRSQGIAAAGRGEAIEVAYSAGEDPARASNRDLIAAVAIDKNAQPRAGDLLLRGRLRAAS